MPPPCAGTSTVVYYVMVSARALLLLALLSGCAPATTPQGDTVEDTPEPSPTVTAEDIEQNPSGSIEALLMSRFPGVTVTRTADGGISLLIRGRTSIHGSNEPLFVIDGVPIEPGPGGALFGINPNDIESIEVLKDAASTTMYGVRGANGVIVIKTKVPERPPPQ